MSQELISSLIVLLLNSLWQGVLIAGVGWLVLHLRKNRLNAATRYLVWYVVLAAIVVVPFARLMVMSNRSERQDQSIRTITQDESTQTLRESGKGTKHTLLVEEAYIQIDESSNAVFKVPGSNWLYAGLWTWMGIVLFLLVRIGRSYRFQRRLLKMSRPLTATESLLPIRLAISVPMRVSDQIMTPMVGGFWGPMILMPATIFDRFDQHEREQIVRHEWAHIRRRDPVTKLVQRVVEALFWFHPVVWWIGRRLDLEREIACDDQTVSQSGHREAYAWCLTKLIEATLRPQPHQLVTTGLIGRRQIERRVDCLLDDRHVNSPQVLKTRTLLGLILIGITVAFVISTPDVLAVEPSESVNTSAIPIQEEVSIPVTQAGTVLQETLQRLSSRDPMMKNPKVYALNNVNETELSAEVRGQEKGRHIRIDVKVDEHDTFVNMKMVGGSRE